MIYKVALEKGWLSLSLSLVSEVVPSSSTMTLRVSIYDLKHSRVFVFAEVSGIYDTL
jgi:hypothetical protein